MRCLSRETCKSLSIFASFFIKQQEKSTDSFSIISPCQEIRVIRDINQVSYSNEVIHTMKLIYLFLAFIYAKEQSGKKIDTNINFIKLRIITSNLYLLWIKRSLIPCACFQGCIQLMNKLMNQIRYCE